jgi:CheY-like chemotaxis protein
MDVRMPIMDGFEATKFIRTNFKPPKSNIPIIALTANAIKGDDLKCIQAGMNDYLSKPFQPETLKNKIIENMDLEGFTKKVNSRPKAETNPNKVIDLTYLREMSDNDLGFITEMVKSFISQSPKDIENIRFHYSNSQLDHVANLIHKIKPSITFMGIHELKDLIVEMEENAKHKKYEPLKEQLDRFEQVCVLAINELKSEFALSK